MIGGVILAGGAGRRMGVRDKAALRVGGVALLDRVLAAARPVCDRLVVVGPTRPTEVPGVEFVTEEHPGGGPVPAVLAGLNACPECDTLLVLATDLPLLHPDHLRLLLSELDHRSGVEVVPARGPQGANPLLAAYRSAALASRAARLGLGPGAAASRLLPDALWAVDLGPATLNVNRPEDLAAVELLVADES